MNKHMNILYDIMQLFSNCTSASIAAFSKDGEFLLDAGVCRCYLYLPKNRKLLAGVVSELTSKQVSKQKGNMPQEPWIVKSFEGIEMAACLINLANEDEGFFFLVPSPKYRNKVPYDLKETVPYLLTLLRKIQKDKLGEKLCEGMTEKIYSFHVQKAVDYIHCFYYEDLTLESMAKKLGLNKSYFASIFKKETGVTFIQMLHNVRIEKGKKSLKESADSILDVALAVGFSNQNYFATVFKKTTGLTPREFRQM